MAFAKSVGMIKDIAQYIRSEFAQELAPESQKFWSYAIINKFKLKHFQILLGNEREQRKEWYEEDWNQRNELAAKVHRAKEEGNRALED